MGNYTTEVKRFEKSFRLHSSRYNLYSQETLVKGATKTHNQAVTAIGKLGDKVVANPSLYSDLLLELLKDCDPKIALCAGFTCMRANIHTDKAIDTLISIAKSTGFNQSVLQKCYNLKRFTGRVASLDSCYALEYATTLTLGGYASFQNCYRLENLYFPSTITSINNRCFENCYYLKEITIPSSVTSIGSSAFYQCSSLQSIEIPSSVTSIGSSCFSYCNDLSTITINKEEDSISGSPWGAPNATVVWTG